MMDRKKNCEFSEGIRKKYIEDYGAQDPESWPNSKLNYTYPNGNCGKDNCQDEDGDCWTYLGEHGKGNHLLGKQDRITTLGPHNKQLHQFIGMSNKKSYKSPKGKRDHSIPIGIRHPER
jgi:hypothetical protein